MIEHIRESFSLGMASEDGDITITVENVTADSTTTEDDAMDKPRVRFSDNECEEEAAPGAKQNNNHNGSEKPTEALSSQIPSQLNGPSSSSSSVHIQLPSPSPPSPSPPSPSQRRHVRRDDTPPLDEKV